MFEIMVEREMEISLIIVMLVIFRGPVYMYPLTCIMIFRIQILGYPLTCIIIQILGYPLTCIMIQILGYLLICIMVACSKPYSYSHVSWCFKSWCSNETLE